MFDSKFNGVVYVYHEEYKSGKFCHSPSKNEEYVVYETFPNVDVMAPLLVNDIFDFTHEDVGVWWYVPPLDVPVFCLKC